MGNPGGSELPATAPFPVLAVLHALLRDCSRREGLMAGVTRGDLHLAQGWQRHLQNMPSSNCLVSASSQDRKANTHGLPPIDLDFWKRYQMKFMSSLIGRDLSGHLPTMDIWHSPTTDIRLLETRSRSRHRWSRPRH